MDDVQSAWWSGRDERARARAARRVAAGRARPAGGRRRRLDDSDADDSDASSTYYQDVDDSDDWDAPGSATTSAVASDSSPQQQQQQQQQQPHTPGASSRRQAGSSSTGRHGVAVGGRAHAHHSGTHAGAAAAPHRGRRGFPTAVSGPAGGAAQGLDEEERDDLWSELVALDLHETLACLGARASAALWGDGGGGDGGGGDGGGGGGGGGGGEGGGGAGERVGSLADMSVACILRDLEVSREGEEEEAGGWSRHSTRGSGRRGGAAAAAAAGGEDAAASEAQALTQVVQMFGGLPSAPGMRAIAFGSILQGGGDGDARAASAAAVTALISKLSKRVAAPGGRAGVPVAVVAEFLTARLLLDHYLAERIETTAIPTTNVHITHGWRAYWAPSLLRLAAARAPGAALTWRALSAANDMITAVAHRVLSLMSATMFDAEANAVEVSGDALLAALRLSLPAPLFEAVAPRARAAMARFRDVECDDISSVTWARLAQQIGLTFEVRAGCVSGSNWVGGWGVYLCALINRTGG